MTRSQFEHVVRAAGAILATNEVLVIGSQAIRGSITGPLPPEAERSVEVDIAAFDDETGAKAGVRRAPFDMATEGTGPGIGTLSSTRGRAYLVYVSRFMKHETERGMDSFR